MFTNGFRTEIFDTTLQKLQKKKKKVGILKKKNHNGYSELLTQFGCDVQIGATTTSLSERLGDLHARRHRR